MESKEILKDFKKNTAYRMNESLRFVKLSLQEISDEEIWQKPNESLNTVGNLILHLCGNMRQYGIDSIRNQKDQRKRDIEFETRGGIPKKELLMRFEHTINEVINSFNAVDDETFMKLRSVQGFEFTGLGNILHVVEHLSYHTGQIAYAVKLLKNNNLGFYDGFDLNTKNE